MLSTYDLNSELQQQLIDRAQSIEPHGIRLYPLQDETATELEEYYPFEEIEIDLPPNSFQQRQEPPPSEFPPTTPSRPPDSSSANANAQDVRCDDDHLEHMYTEGMDLDAGPFPTVVLVQADVHTNDDPQLRAAYRMHGPNLETEADESGSDQALDSESARVQIDPIPVVIDAAVESDALIDAPAEETVHGVDNPQLQDTALSHHSIPATAAADLDTNLECSSRQSSDVPETSIRPTPLSPPKQKKKGKKVREYAGGFARPPKRLNRKTS